MTSINNNTEFFSKKQINSFLFDKSDKINTYTKLQDDSLLAEKQPVIGIDDLAISMTNGLLDAVNAKQNILPDADCITIAQVTTLNTLLGALAPKTSVYTQNATDTLLATKQASITANALSIAMTNGLQTALNLKAVTTDVNTAFSAKQNTITTDALAIGMTNGLTAALKTLSDYDVANTTLLVSKANSADVYTKIQTDSAIAALVNSAPAVLDTLKELATALNNDPAFATTITNLMGTQITTTAAELLI